MNTSIFHSAPPLFLILAVVLAVVVGVLQIGILSYAYEKMGVSRLAALAILFFSLAGARFNLPLADIHRQEVVGARQVTDNWGVRYWVPIVKDWPGTVLAVNIGGAVIPTMLSLYLVVKNQIYLSALAGTALVAAVVHMMAEPVPQMGIAVPVFIPPILAAVVAMVLSRDYAAPVAYVSGCMGTLVGADLLNLGELENLGASVASIGGAGTFDGVFLTGILAVLLAVSPRLGRRNTPPPSQPQPSPPVEQLPSTR